MKKLRVERLDLMQVHNLVDVSTHLATLRDWKASGRVRYLGVTHYHAGAHADLEKVIARGDVDFVQVNYSLVEPEAERRLLRVAADTRTAVIVNRPFAEGALFRRTKGETLPDWAQDIGCASWAQFSLKWILAEPGGDVRHPRDPQSGARRRQHGRGHRLGSRPGHAGKDDRALRLAIARGGHLQLPFSAT